ncbi:MAG TPA: NADH-ubiquinone oxidoreductase-F iron-sulfur binding region domain-containing protein [Streptosporangiaceae bacterium]|nr:NADH-ubiquinone oxidoreductase-F iron-sulfur binding region domain-containing protein [Streptosporangiaceae bacterium]
MSYPPQSSTTPDAARRAEARRLTAGWRDRGRPPSLAVHEDRYGPLPGNPAGRRGRAGLIEAVTAAGLTGRGGAGFPTGAKLRAVAGRRGPAALVANGMECEPASEKDQALLAMAPHLVLDGAVLAARAVGADTVHVCLDRARPVQVEEVFRAAEERRVAGRDDVPVLVHDLPGHYVSGEETALISWLNGAGARPTTVPPRPFERGGRRRPTLVDNVETLAQVALIARYGPDWFRSAGERDAPGTVLVTVSGAVSHPGVYEVAGGTSAGEILALSGSSERGHVLVGGYFGSWHHLDEVARLPFTAAGLRPAGAAPGAGVLYVLPEMACGLAETARVLGYLAGQSARQCGPCTYGLPAIAGDFAQLADARPQGDVLDRLARRLALIPGRGACRHPDGAARLAASALTAFAGDARAHAARRPCAARWRRPPCALPVPRSRAGGGWR